MIIRLAATKRRTTTVLGDQTSTVASSFEFIASFRRGRSQGVAADRVFSFLSTGPFGSFISRLTLVVVVWQWWILTFAFALLLFARNPSVLLAPRFWAEDGWVWYPDAYQYGLAALTRPIAGYLQTLPRLIALVVEQARLVHAPALFAIAAFIIQLAPPLLLVSTRMAPAWPGNSRLIFALVWILLPNSAETFVNLTNSQWHFAAFAFLILFSTPRLISDLSILLLSGLSGPFCIMLFPVATWLAWNKPRRASILRAACLGLTCLIQVPIVLMTHNERSPAFLGGSFDLLMRIVAQDILVSLLLGQTHMRWMQGVPGWVTTIIVLLAVFLTLVMLQRGPPILKGAVVAAGALFVAALVRPQISVDQAQWPLMLNPGTGQRYYLIPMLAWLGVLFTSAGSRVPWQRVSGYALLMLSLIGITADFHQPARPGPEWVSQAKRFERAAPGSRQDFHFPPVPDAVMRLVKR